MFGTVEPPPSTPLVKEVMPGAVELAVLEDVVPPSTKPEVLELADREPVAVPAIDPVHTAFDGQQAMFPASS